MFDLQKAVMLWVILLSILFVLLTAIIVAIELSRKQKLKQTKHNVEILEQQRNNTFAEIQHQIAGINHKLVSVDSHQKINLNNQYYKIKQELHEIHNELYLQDKLRSQLAASLHHNIVPKQNKILNDEIKTVVFVEPRKHKLFKACLSNVSTQLPEWKIQIFCGINNYDFVQNILEELQISDRTLIVNTGIENFDTLSYNFFITSFAFWEQVLGEVILLTQTDAWICQTEQMLKPFYKYDYVGAPWNKPSNEQTFVGNCGLALCKKSSMLLLVQTFPFKSYVNETNNTFADVYFSKHIPNIPSYDIAKQFSVENVWYPTPFGVHKPQPEYIERLCKTCPGIETLRYY